MDTLPAVHTVVVRVWLPDRPGALGQVASRIGAVRGDVLGIEILERGGGSAVDELLVGLPGAELVDLLIAEISAVDGVSVEHVRRVDDDRLEPDVAALTLVAQLAETTPRDRLEVLCSVLAQMADADWSIVLHDGRVLHVVGSPPDLPWLLAYLDGSEHLRSGGDEPSDLFSAHLGRSGIVLAAGRASRPVHARERERVALLARVADALVDGP
jgi:hypothetical protein